MNHQIAAVAFGLAALTLGALALPSWRWWQAIAYAASVGCVLLAICAALGRPVPQIMVVPTLRNVPLFAVVPDEPRAIYLLVQREGDAQPQLVQVPWSEKDAQDGQDALDKAKKEGGQARWKGKPGGQGDQGQQQAGGQNGQGGTPSDANSGQFYVMHGSPLPPKGGRS